MVLVEGALVIAALLIAGALAGYLWHERRAQQREEVFVDFQTARTFLQKRYGVTLTKDEWDSMAQSPHTHPEDASGQLAP